jgi:hypothetical protein
MVSQLTSMLKPQNTRGSECANILFAILMDSRHVIAVLIVLVHKTCCDLTYDVSLSTGPSPMIIQLDKHVETVERKRI